MNHRPVAVCLLLGSNIDPERNLRRAVNRLDRIFGLDGLSNAWETPAFGSDGPNFLNAAVLLHTSLTPLALKERLLRPLEAELGRLRGSDKFAPRTMDIDIVSWNYHPMEEDLWEYAHRAVPVSELLPRLVSPQTGESLGAAAARLASGSAIWLRLDVLKLQPGSFMQPDLLTRSSRQIGSQVSRP